MDRVRVIHRLPRPVVRFLRDAWLQFLDWRDRLHGRGGDLVPPRCVHYVGPGDFRVIGERFLRHFIELAGLEPDHRVLDVGCGVGRIAVPLLSYMDDSGRYTGFDVSRDAINWCRTHVAPRRSGFEFVHADVHNREYNPSGSVAATAYRFPSDDESIDCVVATSVLTHLGADEVSHYLREIRRVLAPGGRAVLTWFIIDDSAARVMEERRAAFRFDIRLPVGFTIDARTPERAVAFTEDEVYRLLGQAGLAVVPPIHFGSWSHHENALDGQDITVVKRSANGNQEP